MAGPSSTADTATFGGVAGTVSTFSSSQVTTGKMTFTTPGYILSGDSGAQIKIGTGGITVNASSSGVTQINDGLSLAGNQTWAVDTGSALQINGTVSSLYSSYTVNKTGAGSLLLAGTNSYTGSTTVSAGTLTLSSSGNALAGSVVVNSGALELGQSNQIKDTANMTLGGGLFQTDGHNETVANLTMTASSQIDLGTGNSTLKFTSGSGILNSFTGTLSILNWSGNLSGAGTDQLFFGTSKGLNATQLGQIKFVTGSGSLVSADQLMTGEVVPNSAIGPAPEPGGLVPLVLGIAGVGTLIARRCRNA